MLIKILLLIWTLLSAFTRAATEVNKVNQDNGDKVLAAETGTQEPISARVKGSTDLPKEERGTVWMPIFTEDKKSENLTQQDLKVFIPETENKSLNHNEAFDVDSSNKSKYVVYEKVAFLNEEDKSRYLLNENQDSHKKFPHTKKELSSRQDSWASKQEPIHHWQPHILHTGKTNNITKIRTSMTRAPKHLNNSGTEYYSNLKPKLKANTTSNDFSGTKQAIFANKKEPGKVILDSADHQSKATEKPKENNLQTNQPVDKYQAIIEVAEPPIENGTKPESDTADYEIPNDFQNDYLTSDVIPSDGPTPDAKNIQKEQVKGTDDKLMKLLDSVQNEIKNTQINGSKKEMVKAKIKNIFDTVVGINLTTTSKENIEISSVDKKHRTQFPLKSGLSEGEFQTKQRVDDEEKELLSTKSDELHKYEEMRPTYQYRYNTKFVSSKTSESSMPVKEIEHPNYFVGVPWRRVTHKLYNSDKISDLNGEYPKLRHDEDYQRDYGYKKKLNSFIANNHNYTNYDTESDYGRDPLDEGRRNEKVEELEKRYQIPYQTNQQRNNGMEDMANIENPEYMRERMRALEESRAPDSRYYENNRARLLGYY